MILHLPFSRFIGLLLAAIALPCCTIMHAADSEPLDFRFIQNPPGQFVALEHHRLHVDCRGTGNTTVLFEPGLGGSALEWLPIRDQLAKRTSTCIYDRAGYAWSDPSPYPRVARQLASEAKSLLSHLQLTESLILVAHSYGGFVARELAMQSGINVAAMVLIDSSHEDQFERLAPKSTVAMLPGSNHFMISGGDVPENLPADIKLKVRAFARLRKTYNATHGELSKFGESAKQIKATRSRVSYPVTIISRGKDLYTGTRHAASKNVIWQSLQQDLVLLSRDGRFVKSSDSGHHVHIDEPSLVVRIVEGLLDEIEAVR